jgi:hypothetical protein
MSDLQQLRTTPPYDEPWKQATLINKLVGGRINSVGTVTLTNGGTQTLLSDNHIQGTSLLFFQARTANAAAVAASLWYDAGSIPAGGGTVTLNHASSAHGDLSFGYLVLT